MTRGPRSPHIRQPPKHHRLFFRFKRRWETGRIETFRGKAPDANFCQFRKKTRLSIKRASSRRQLDFGVPLIIFSFSTRRHFVGLFIISLTRYLVSFSVSFGLPRPCAVLNKVVSL